MKVAVLTSSRADYGIYLPLLRALQEDPDIDAGLIVFGSHTSHLHGHTIDQIRADGFRIDAVAETILTSDSQEAIATSMGLTQLKFASLWGERKQDYDIVFCLGDRYEMFAAVAAGIPFGISFAHIHGGETTMGAIDNEFRHSITLYSKLHFASTAQYCEKIIQITGNPLHVYDVGSLSLDNIGQTRILSLEEFKDRFKIDLSQDTLLVTFHPETRAPEKNIDNAVALCEALEAIDMQAVITMPNADTSGNGMRNVYLEAAARNPRFQIIENFGTQGYFSCMHHAKLIIGNSSSGIIEAASFKKYVVNIGNRQEGRAASENVYTIPPDKQTIIETIATLLSKGPYAGSNIYYKQGTAKAILAHLKRFQYERL